MSSDDGQTIHDVTTTKTTNSVTDDDDESAACYAPIENLEDLLAYGPEPPNCTRLRETIPVAKNFSDIKIQVNGRRFKRNFSPKTLVCHDFKGGYLDDKFIHGTKNPENYVFRHWLQTDIFCYFSHKFVSIPPVGWINSAHRHGVQIIGTIITECDDGKLLCQKLLKDSETIQKAVEKLCLVAKHYKFDGYLVNIENELEDTKPMIEFLKLLTVKMKDVVPDSFVIWYDSVCIDGSLKWQNELNSTNKAFFEVCDGIYLNYGHTTQTLHSSLEAAEDRELDVYVGVDVFGRGCFGGGGLETWQAVEKAASARLSVAIFAPGWTFETQKYEDFPVIDGLLWNKCAKYYYFRTLTNVPLESSHANSESKNYQVIMSTDFDQGFGKQKSFFGQRQLQEDENLRGWFDLHEQSYQPVINCFRSSEGNPFGFEARYDPNSLGFLGGGSIKLTSQHPFSIDCQIEPACPIWVPLNIPLKETMEIRPDLSKCAIIGITVWRKNEMDENTNVSNNPIKIFVDFMKSSISTRKVIRLSNLNDQIAFEQPENPIIIHFKDFVPKKYPEHSFPKEINELKFTFTNVPYAQEEINGWMASCFLMDVNHCIDWTCTSFRLTALNNISLGFLSVGLLKY